MFSDEIKQVIYIGINMTVLAMVLGLIMLATDVQRNFATIRNDEIATAQQTSAYREFSAYNNRYITSEEAIAVISKYYDSGIDIYFRDGVKEIRVNTETIKTNPEYTSLEWLQSSSGVGGGSKYKAVVVYDYDDVTGITDFTNDTQGYYDDVTGIAIVR